MHILRWTFVFLTSSGCLRPYTWITPGKILFYNIYTAFSFLLLHSLLLGQILDLVLNVDSQDDFYDNVYLTVGIFLTCCKMWTLLLKRDNIAALMDTLREEPFVPVDASELNIRTRFNNLAEWNAIIYGSLLGFCVICIFGTTAVTNFEDRTLKLRVWIPYDFSSLLLFTVTYAYQVASLALGACSNIAWDSLFGSLLIHTSCQLELLEYRLKNITKNENILVKHCARHQELIYRFATSVNNTFEILMLIQFCSSTIVLCFNLYRITQKQLDSELLEIVVFVACTLMQIFYYCWYCNEVEMKSLGVPIVIFESNWISWNKSARGVLLMIMRRATRPITFTTARIVSMNLESFKTVLKTSYSAFNLLQQRYS